MPTWILPSMRQRKALQKHYKKICIYILANFIVFASLINGGNCTLIIAVIDGSILISKFFVLLRVKVDIKSLNPLYLSGNSAAATTVKPCGKRKFQPGTSVTISGISTRKQKKQ